MDITKSDFFQGFIRICTDGWEQGWHERNGGNLTYRMTPEEVESVREELHFNGEWLPAGIDVPGLAGEFFLVTGSGKYFRNLSLAPEESAAIIELDESGSRYRICRGLSEGGKPTSELPTHLLNHQSKKEASGGTCRVIYHAHPVNVIALTFVLPLEDRVFTRELWEMATECPVVFPEGIGVVPWMVPGGREIAVKTAVLMEKYNAVVWAHHGLVVSGESFDGAFGLMHTIEKAAETLVKVISMNKPKAQTILPDDFRELARAFNVSLPEEFLYEK